MSTRHLPERASLAYLKKLAKERLAARRTTDPATKLADTQLAIAREYGFSSWRALKAEIDRRRAPTVAEFLRACTAGDVDTLRELLKNDPGLVGERIAAGSTGLHQAVRHPDALRLLIEEEPEVRFDEDLFEPFYGGRQFSICDNNGLSLLFWQPAWLKPSSPAHARVQP